MFRILASVPGRVKNLFSYFKPYFTKPQFNNFCRAEMGLIGAGKKEHDIVSMNKLFMDRKDQSSLNRFFTNAKWTLKGITDQGKKLLLREAAKQPEVVPSETVEHRSIDDTVCRKYSSKTEMACYNYSSTMGRVLSHDFVTSIYQNGQIKIPDSIRLYGIKRNAKRKE